MEFLKHHSIDGKSTRRVFIGIGSALLGLIGLRKVIPNAKPNNETYRFLSHDGTLVEVERRHKPKTLNRVKSAQLASWVWKDNHHHAKF